MKNEKARVTSSSLDQNLIFTGSKNKDFDVSNYKTRHTVKQRICVCGTEISRDEVIFSNAKLCSECTKKQSALTTIAERIITSPRTVFKCHKCRNCKRPFALPKLVSDLLVCRDCLQSARTVSPAKRNRIVAEIIKNYTAAVERQIQAGGLSI